MGSQVVMGIQAWKWALAVGAWLAAFVALGESAAWAVTPDHSGFTAATSCVGCHNGAPTVGKPGSHIPVGSTNCVACHSATGKFRPSSFSHTQVAVTGQCASCHTGSFPPADGKPSNHVPYGSLAATASANCDACHKGSYATWKNGKLHANYSLSAQCATCHTGNYLAAVGKPATAIHAGMTSCEGCHKSTVAWGGKPDHAVFTAATSCVGCHNGAPTVGKPGSHIPVGSTNCVACHSATGKFRPSSFSHTQVAVTGQCASCHTGSFPPADGKPSNHVPYASLSMTASANCDACHKGSYATWKNGKLHANYSLSGQCATCHTGNYLAAVGKPATAIHAGVTSCEGCHKSSTWHVNAFSHSAANAVGTGSCDTCHGAGPAKGKSSGHVPITVSNAKCDSCHKSLVSFATSVTMNHNAVSSMMCKACHSGSYLGHGQRALAKPGNHIPETMLVLGGAMDCRSCHLTSSSWKAVKMDHNGSQGGGAGWCKGCHLAGTKFSGRMERMALSHDARHRPTPNPPNPPNDCSSAGCHKPLGNKGASFAKWD